MDDEAKQLDAVRAMVLRDRDQLSLAAQYDR